MIELKDKKGRTFAYRVIDNPCQALSDREKQLLVDQLTPVTARGFLRREITQELRDDVKNHVIDCHRLGIAECGDGEVAAFCARSIRCVEPEGVIYHLEGIIVEDKSQGLGRAILHKELQDTKADILAFHTQSIRMIRLGQALSEMDVLLAIKLAMAINSRNPQGDIDIDRYGGKSLYGDVDAFSIDAIGDIDWRRGDAKIFAGRIRK